MTRSVAIRLTLTLVAMTFLGWLAVDRTGPGIDGISVWPTGLAAGAMLLSPSWLRGWLSLAIAVLATCTYLLGGVAPGIAVGAVVAQQVYAPGSIRRISLRHGFDLVPYALANLLAGASTGVVFFLTALASSHGNPVSVGLAGGIATLTSNAILFALFREPGRYPGVASRTERILTWILVLSTSYVALDVAQGASLSYLTLPLLGWAAFRLPLRDSVVLLVVISTLGIAAFTHGHGPFQSDGALEWLPPEFHMLPVITFILAGAMLVVPFATTVGMQRRSESEAIMERARSMRLIQAARGIAIIGTDQLGRINLFNPGAELILGYTPQEVYGQSMRMFFSQIEIARQANDLGTDPTYMSVLPAMLRLPPGTAREWQFTRKDGLERTLSTILSAVNDDRGKFVGYVMTADDVTEQLRTQVALEKALETERRAVSRLIEVDQVKDAFVSAVSHELRTPITNIVGYLELLLDDSYGMASGPQRQALNRVDMNSRRLLTLIDDLLTLSSVENMEDAQLQDPVDLGQVVARAHEIVRPSLEHRELTVEVETPDRSVVISGDAGQLERLVINLASNAIKFTPDGGKVSIRLLRESDVSVLEIEDSGIGIADEEQPMLFSRFFRTTQARETAVQGSGLGLSITKSIAERHGGRISVRSRLGQGTVFRVEIPLRDEHTETSGSPTHEQDLLDLDRPHSSTARYTAVTDPGAGNAAVSGGADRPT